MAPLVVGSPRLRFHICRRNYCDTAATVAGRSPDAQRPDVIDDGVRNERQSTRRNFRILTRRFAEIYALIA